ncbi:energy transducer TonB [Sandaracinobacter sp. RS1-74]|uniref:energy transducer TonB family protein n=1 Tax=Sandaracinobacteroides sayramensis TaxID=2913411 RepID=UPI001EDC00C5|nr:energy transducer TonB [Sandaracinobacteroides sayramensis]MCG2840690.1 energy transducer TonB [Sandaracinobacteroides sayramensis]
MRSGHDLRHDDRGAEATMPGYLVMTAYDYSRNDGPAPVEPMPASPLLITEPPSRYCDQPMDWRTRLIGMGGTAGVFLVIITCALFTLRVVQPVSTPPILSVFDVSPPAAPPEPVQEVPEGPQQVEQKEQKPKEQEERPEPPEIVLPQVSPITTPSPPLVEQVQAADPVPQTTAPKSLPAPPANRAAHNAEATWEAMLLAHLEKYRRYPATARARGAQGVAHVRFRMNRQGAVLLAEILHSSGVPALDRAALETLRRAQPLPAIPDERPDPLDLVVPVEFFVRG